MDKRPLYTRTPDGSLTTKGCIDLCTYWLNEAEWEDNTEDAAQWQQLLKGFLLEQDLGLYAWTSCPIIENKLKEDDAWTAAYVPWEDRRALNDEG